MTTKLEDLIVTHNTDRNRHFPEADYRSFLLIMHVQSGLGQHPPEDKVEGEVWAHVSFGRWCVTCDICLSAVVAEPTDAFFCCTSCGSGGAWRRVIFPKPDLMGQMEAILLMRPGFRHNAPKRNWNRTETLDDLRRQNIAAGDSVDHQPTEEMTV